MGTTDQHCYCLLACQCSARPDYVGAVAMSKSEHCSKELTRHGLASSLSGGTTRYCAGRIPLSLPVQGTNATLGGDCWAAVRQESTGAGLPHAALVSVIAAACLQACLLRQSPLSPAATVLRPDVLLQVIDSKVLRFPKAVTHFSPGSHASRPRQQTSFGNVFIAGDWVRDLDHGANGLSQVSAPALQSDPSQSAAEAGRITCSARGLMPVGTHLQTAIPIIGPNWPPSPHLKLLQCCAGTCLRQWTDSCKFGGQAAECGGGG